MTERGRLSRDEVRAQFIAWADIYTPGISPLYEALSRIVIRHDELLDLAGGVRPGQPAPNMLFGAVQMILLSGDSDTELRRFYPGLGGREPPEAPGLEESFLTVCRRHRERLGEIIAARVTNTNEVQRCACLMPAFVTASKVFGGVPFHLVEIGPSAGFNLLWDRYAYRYEAADGTVVSAGERRAGGLLLHCALRGAGRPRPGGSWPPPLASRLGIERHPVDLTDREERLWLRALIWPEHVERAERLERALEIAAADPPPIRRGEALSLLPEVLAALPPAEPACVEHSFVLAQFSKEERRELQDRLTHAARGRRLLRISYESQVDRPEALLRLQDLNEGTVERLAFCDSHGSWLEWLRTEVLAH